MRSFGENVDQWTPPPVPKKVVITGHYAILEPLSSDLHSAELFTANSESDLIWGYLPYGPFDDLVAYQTWVRSIEGQPDPFFYAVKDKVSGKALGVLSYLRVAPAAGSIEVGHINFSLPLQRTTAATEAVYLLMKWAFEAGYRRFEWKCDAMNHGSRAAAQRFGFSYEGIFRQAGVVKGRNRDTAWFACIDKEWADLQAAYSQWLAEDNFDQSGRQKTSLADLTRAIRVADDPVLAG